MGREDKQYPPMDWWEPPRATFEDRLNHKSCLPTDPKLADGGIEEGCASYAIYLDSSNKNKSEWRKEREKNIDKFIANSKKEAKELEEKNAKSISDAHARYDALNPK